jgi:hypothetical protein
MERLLRQLLREIIEEETRDLEEFSGVAALGGGPVTPLGVDATYPARRRKPRRKGKRVNEVNTVAIAIGPFVDVNDNGIPDNLETNMFRERSDTYEDSVECLARSFGGAKSPFKNQREVEKFLRYDP